MAGDRCTVSQMADVIMEGLEGKEGHPGECPCEDWCLRKELGGEDHEGNCKCNGDRGVFQEQVPAGPSAGVRPCAEKRRQDKGVSPYCACRGKGCADSGTGSGEGTEVMAGGEST